MITVKAGDCLGALAAMPDDSVDAIVTDPPYGLSNTDPGHVADAVKHWATGDTTYVPKVSGGFMGKAWDSFVPPPAVWVECLRVLKPGGHLLCFAGTRTMDLMSLAIRLAGFDIRDSIAWMYGSGFPKSMDVSKAIDKAAPATPEAEQWQGWGTALKPAFEPVVVARKPFIGTVAANVLEHGTGALNIDTCRIGTMDNLGGGANKGMTSDTRHEGFARPWMDDDETREAAAARSRENTARAESLGRWPANVILDENRAAALDEQSGIFKGRVGMSAKTPVQFGVGHERTPQAFDHGAEDVGGASRFFYCAKAPKKERPIVDGIAHPTVKPLALMRYLVRLVTPPRGTVLDPFAGSGTTLQAGVEAGFHVIGIERDPDYLKLIDARLGLDLL